MGILDVNSSPTRSWPIPSGQEEKQIRPRPIVQYFKEALYTAAQKLI